MQKRERVLATQPFIQAMECPYCGSSFQVLADKSLTCRENGHSFDIAKQGYVNLLTKPVNSLYSKTLFAARRHIVMGSGLYKSLHDNIARLISQHFVNELQASGQASSELFSGELQAGHSPVDSNFEELCSTVESPALHLLDAGCGEGAHLQSIVERTGHRKVVGVGVDIAKQGIAMAAGSFQNTGWLVGDLSRLPISAQCFDVLLNIMSPSNYEEFKRVLRPNGMIIKVIPRQHYFQQLRVVLHGQSSREKSSNERIVKLFRQHFSMQEILTLTYTHRLERQQLHDLVMMSPLAWNAQQADIDFFLKQANGDLTIDVDVLVGRNSQ